MSNEKTAFQIQFDEIGVRPSRQFLRYCGGGRIRTFSSSPPLSPSFLPVFLTVKRVKLLEKTFLKIYFLSQILVKIDLTVLKFVNV